MTLEERKTITQAHSEMREAIETLYGWLDQLPESGSKDCIISAFYDLVNAYYTQRITEAIAKKP